MAKKITLSKASDGFIGYLESLGKTASTVGTARRALDLFVEHQGADKQFDKLLPVHIGRFFKSEAATKLPGKDKERAPASICQIRRIVRQFLVWSTEQGYLDKAPLPKDEASRGGGARVPETLDVEGN